MNIYYQIVKTGDEFVGNTKKSINLFTSHGPFQDLNSELQKPNFQMENDEMEDLDNEVAMIFKKAPKSGNSGNEEENKKKSMSGPSHIKSPSTENEKNKAPLASIIVGGARGLQSKLNLIPLFNIKSLFLRNNRLEEALEIEYMTGLSLICSRRYVQAMESFKRVQTDVLSNLKKNMKEQGILENKQK